MIPKLFDPAAPAPVPAGQPLTVRHVINRYLDHCRINSRHCAEARYARERTFDAFMEATGSGWVGPLGDIPVVECLPCFLQDWIEAHQRWRSSSTRKAKANQINAAFNWAAKTKRIADNPFSGVNYEEAERRPCLPDDVLAKVLAKASKPLDHAFTFLRLTGCRLSEMFRLRWEHIDWESGIARLPATMHKSGKKTKKGKPIVLLPETLELLTKIKTEDYREGEVFRNNRGTPWNRRTLGQSLKRIKKRLGIDCPATLHGIRHQLATVAVKAKAPLKAVQRLLGHSSQAVTERYYVHDEDDYDAMRQAAEAARMKPIV